MVITEADIAFHYSGGPNNDDKNESYGNELSSVTISGANTHNLFGPIIQAARDIGSTTTTGAGVPEYRVFYVKINPLSEGDGNAGKLWISLNTMIDALSFRLAVGTKNTIIPKPASPHIPPPGMTFINAPTSQVTGINLPAVGPGDFIPIAIERSISATHEVMLDGILELSFFWQSISEAILMEFNTLLASGMNTTTYGNPNNLATKNPYPTPYVDMTTVSAAWVSQGKKLFFSNNVEDGGGLRDTPILINPSGGDGINWEVRLWYYDRFTNHWYLAGGGATEGWTGRKIQYIRKPLFVPSFLQVVSVSDSGNLEMRVNDVLVTVR